MEVIVFYNEEKAKKFRVAGSGCQPSCIYRNIYAPLVDKPGFPIDNAAHFFSGPGSLKNSKDQRQPAVKPVPAQVHSFSMKVVFRRIAGFLVNFIGFFTRPVPLVRSEHERRQLSRDIKALRVYDYPTCPSSLKLRHTLHRLNLGIQYCDIRKCQVHRDNLLAELGRVHAPCLRIENNQQVQWLDEPEQIIHYLNQRFDPVAQQARQAA
jgi:glutaredoxin